ncbi:MAG: hypothetical protein L0177_03570 [Chloroflexi bacterium]|nr:hypothetical protein [Chloroflexota bacterium]
MLPLIGFLALVSLVISLMSSESSVEAACSIQSTTTFDVSIVGGKHENISNLEGARADLWNYDPTPVFDENPSTFWVMVWKDSPDKWAQIGWIMWGDQDESKVFLQVLPDTGPAITRYRQSDGSWSSNVSSAVHPTASKQYEVFRFNGEWWLSYDFGGDYFKKGTNWEAEHVRVAGETQTYEAVAGTDKGDHFPGDLSNKIQANNVGKNVSGTWSDTSLSEINSGSGNGDSDLSNSSGDGVRVWDVRCND